LFATAFVALLSFEIFAHLGHLLDVVLHALGLKISENAMIAIDVIFLGGYVSAFVFVFQRFFVARAAQHQERFLDYRALAEALRVAIFWKLAGIASGEAWLGTGSPSAGAAAPGGIFSIADVYPLKQPSELAWVKTCLRTLELLDSCDPPSGTGGGLNQTTYAWVRDLWIGGQLAYFNRRRHSHSESAEKREAQAIALVVVSIIFAFVLIVLKIRFTGWHHQAWHHDALIFVIALLPGLAAALLGYSEKLASKAQARQYDRMGDLFDRASMLLPEKLNIAEAALDQSLFAELGLEAMRETAEWVAIYRQRPIQPP
jgi:hypothetical protein